MEAVDASGCAINYQGLDNLCEWGWDEGWRWARLCPSWWAPEGPSVPSALCPLQWP